MTKVRPQLVDCWYVAVPFHSWTPKNTKNSYFLMSVASLYTPCFVMFCVFCTGYFVMVPINLTCPHCLHVFFVQLFHLYWTYKQKLWYLANTDVKGKRLNLNIYWICPNLFVSFWKRSKFSTSTSFRSYRPTISV